MYCFEFSITYDYGGPNVQHAIQLHELKELLILELFTSFVKKWGECLR